MVFSKNLCINGVLIVMFFNGLCFHTFICLVFLVVGFPPFAILYT
jgi:hypothetical protein